MARSRQRNSPSCATPVGVHANWGACLALARARQSNSPTSATPVGVRAEVSVERAAAAAQQQLDMCNQSASTLIGLACRVWRGRGTATIRHVTCAPQSASASTLIGVLRSARPRALQQVQPQSASMLTGCAHFLSPLFAHPPSLSQSILPSTKSKNTRPKTHLQIISNACNSILPSGKSKNTPQKHMFRPF